MQQGHTHDLLSIDPFLQQQKNQEIVTQILGPAKPQIPAAWPFTEYICHGSFDGLQESVCFEKMVSLSVLTLLRKERVRIFNMVQSGRPGNRELVSCLFFLSDH